MKCFGNKGKTFHVKIVLLDEHELLEEIQVGTIGQDLLDVVFKHLNLLETAYFGLRFLGEEQQSHWLDPCKRVWKQLHGPGPHNLYFAVKYYASDPCKLLEEITRYQFFLQAKQDVLQGRLPVPSDLAAELAALAVQSELGDYDPRRHTVGYLSEFRFVSNQTPDLEARIADLHMKYAGMVPALAEMKYLDKVKWLDLYGVDLHPVLGENTVEYFLGITPSGVIVLRNKNKVGNYFWPRITKVYSKGRFFMLRVLDKNNDQNTYGFETPSKEASRALCKCCSEHLAFFKLVQLSGPPVGKFFSWSWGHKSEVDNVAHRSPPTFKRTLSRGKSRRDGDNEQDAGKADEGSDSDKKSASKLSSTYTITGSKSCQSFSSLQRTVLDTDSRKMGPKLPPSDSLDSGKGLYLAQENSRNRAANEQGLQDSFVNSRHRSCSVDSRASNSSGSHRRHRRRSRKNSDNESDVSQSSQRSRRRRRRSRSRDSNGDSETDKQSNHSGRSRRRHKRRDSTGSTYEWVDSEAQWREVQQKLGLHNQESSSFREFHSASSLIVHEAMVKKATEAIPSSTLQDKGKLTDEESGSKDEGFVNGGLLETESESSSSRHQKHKHRRKHHHRSHREKHRSLPLDVRPHIQFDLVDPPNVLSPHELKDIPYKVATKEGTTPPLDGESPPPPYTPPSATMSEIAKSLSAMQLKSSHGSNSHFGHGLPEPQFRLGHRNTEYGDFVVPMPSLGIENRNLPGPMVGNQRYGSTCPPQVPHYNSLPRPTAHYPPLHHQSGFSTLKPSTRKIADLHPANVSGLPNTIAGKPMFIHPTQQHIISNYQPPSANSLGQPFRQALPTTGKPLNGPSPFTMTATPVWNAGSNSEPVAVMNHVPGPANVSTVASCTKVSPLSAGAQVRPSNSGLQNATIAPQSSSTKFLTLPQPPQSSSHLSLKPCIKQPNSAGWPFAYHPEGKTIEQNNSFPYAHSTSSAHATLPRPLHQRNPPCHIPASQYGTIRKETRDVTAIPSTTSSTAKQRVNRHQRAPSLEMILSPMIQSTMSHHRKAIH